MNDGVDTVSQDPAAAAAVAPAADVQGRAIAPAPRLTGQVRVPGEPQLAAQLLWLAAVAEGDSHFQRLPPAAQATIDVLGGLGVGIDVEGDAACVHGAGLHGLRAPAGVLELQVPPAAVAVAVGILSQQAFVTRLRLAPEGMAAATGLLELLARTGAAGAAETDAILRLDGAEAPAGADHPEAGLSAEVKLGLLAAGLFGAGPTVLREPPSCKDRADAVLKVRGVAVEGSRQADPKVRTITLRPGAPRGLDVELPGDLDRALPFLVAGLVVPKADVHVRRVLLRPEKRTFVDVLRQLGAALQIADNDDGSVDLHVKATGRLKSTRIAEKRTTALREHVALLAVLATQTEGEFIIRDVDGLRDGLGYDFVDYLAECLRAVDAKVGEYSYGLVIDGGRPLTGARIDCRGHAGLAQAFAVAGLVAGAGDRMELAGGDGVELLHPGFYDTLDALRPGRAKEKAS